MRFKATSGYQCVNGWDTTIYFSNVVFLFFYSDLMSSAFIVSIAAEHLSIEEKKNRINL